MGLNRGSLVAVSVAMGLLMATAAKADIYADIAGAVDFGTVIVGVGLIAVAIAAILVAKKGAHLLLGFLGR
jgi:hypothetical protein